MECTGIPVITISRGRIVWRDGKITAERGSGKYIDRPTWPVHHHNQMLRNEVAEPTAVDRSHQKASK